MHTLYCLHHVTHALSFMHLALTCPETLKPWPTSTPLWLFYFSCGLIH